MSYEIELHKSVAKFLKKQDKDFLKRVDFAFEKLSQNPFNFKELDIKMLEGSEKDYRLRDGKYRFIYTVFENRLIIYVYDAGSRGDVYKS
ncbi:MAG: type II toxin-antitoxin system RelE/ParE family toxin [Campylobacterales bacterium]|nr:type II toxin-antitoxin system RelE/ParE family toxin [Campylobacterales bacterium]